MGESGTLLLSNVCLEILSHVRLTQTSFKRHVPPSYWIYLASLNFKHTISKDKKVPLLGCPVAGFVLKLAIKVFCNHACPCQRFESCDRVEREYSEFLGELMNPLEDWGETPACEVRTWSGMEQEEPVWAREDCGIPHTKPRIQSKVLNVLEGDRFVFIHNDLKFNYTL